MLDWRAAEAAGSGRDASVLRGLVESLSKAGFDIVIANGASVEQVDAGLAARPRGPGELCLLLEHGHEAFAVDAEGPRAAETVSRRAPERDRWIFEHLRRRGLRAADVLVVGDALDLPGGVLVSPAMPGDVLELLADQLRRREARELPSVPGDPGWTLAFDGVTAAHERVHEALLSFGDGVVGTKGNPILDHPAVAAGVLAAGLYDGEGPETSLLPCPIWSRLPGRLHRDDRVRRRLDLKTGSLHQEIARGDERLRAMLFSSQARPGTVVLRATGPAPQLGPGSELVAPHGGMTEMGALGARRWMRSTAAHGGLVAAAVERREACSLDRLGIYLVDPDAPPDPNSALAALRRAERAGFEGLLNEHRQAWSRRWEHADVTIEGDSELQLAVRLALFQLMAAVGDHGASALGARGLSGPAYRGHVFWDTDVFVLPFFAATHPPAARALLEYRVRRLPAALTAARRLGRAGARFPWESAGSGDDVTPPIAHDRAGRPVPIRTGELEEHIVADVAWATACYLDWTGDNEFAAGPGLALLVETARYWASRVRIDRQGRGHIDGVIGPDEYHEPVDDNAYTNVMARWNLRRAAAAGSSDVDPDERQRWLAIADALVDGYDPETCLYEQFAGFFDLEPLLIAQIAPTRPVAADALLGSERVRSAQIVKQADVLMLHHLVPQEVVPGSLEPNLSFYEPRTAHGSSLSPGVHAALFARAGRVTDALEAVRLTSRVDLDDLTQTTGGGLHMAAMGSLWQAVAFGFGGIRPSSEALLLDPRLPPEWEALELRLVYRGSRIHVRVEQTAVSARADPPCPLRIGQTRIGAAAGITRVERRRGTWEIVP